MVMNQNTMSAIKIDGSGSANGTIYLDFKSRTLIRSDNTFEMRMLSETSITIQGQRRLTNSETVRTSTTELRLIK